MYADLLSFFGNRAGLKMNVERLVARVGDFKGISRRGTKPLVLKTKTTGH